MDDRSRINFKSERETKTAKQLAFYESQKVYSAAVFIEVHRTNRGMFRTGRPKGPSRFTLRKLRRVIVPRRVEALRRAEAAARAHEKADRFTVTQKARSFGGVV